MQIWRGSDTSGLRELQDFNIDYFYITGGDAVADSYALDACDRVKEEGCWLHNAQCDVHCIGAQQLWEQVQRRPPKSKAMRWAETPMSTSEGFVGLVQLKEFSAFLADQSGELEERIFESNVRGYQQDSAVNEGHREHVEQWRWSQLLAAEQRCYDYRIRRRLRGTSAAGDRRSTNRKWSPDFARIFKYFSANKDAVDDRTVLVRGIQISDQPTQDRIIRATNSQNKMLPASLRMTDQVHRDIEELLRKVDLFYDRRKGFYRDQGKPVRKIVSVNAVTPGRCFDFTSAS